MKEVLKKLANIANRLDEAGHKDQANKIDEVLMEITADLNVVADAPFTGAANMSPEEIAMMQGSQTQTQLPQTMRGRVVIKSKSPEAAGYGFFGADQISAAVEQGKVDPNDALLAMKAYLQLNGSTMQYNTLQGLLVSATANGFIPATGTKPPEVYGAKSFWQKLMGR